MGSLASSWRRKDTMLRFLTIVAIIAVVSADISTTETIVTKHHHGHGGSNSGYNYGGYNSYPYGGYNSGYNSYPYGGYNSGYNTYPYAGYQANPLLGLLGR